jgi:hypothetical protein
MWSDKTILRHYDRYPVLCNDSTFSFHFLQYVAKTSTSWSPVATPGYTTLVRVCGSVPSEVLYIQQFLRASSARVIKHTQFPHLFSAATEADVETVGPCTWHAALEQVSQAAVEKRVEQGPNPLNF